MEKKNLELFRSEIVSQWQLCKHSKRINEFQNEQYNLLLRLREHTRNGKALSHVARNTNDVREKALTYLALFLWEYEVSYMYLINTICNVLVLNGHDLLNSFNREYAVSMKEIAEVESSTKLRFLKEHNFGMMIRDQDRAIRNNIAHGDYELDNNGTVKIDGKRENILSLLDSLLDFEKQVDEIITDLVDEQFRTR